MLTLTFRFLRACLAPPLRLCVERLWIFCCILLVCRVFLSFTKDGEVNNVAVRHQNARKAG